MSTDARLTNPPCAADSIFSRPFAAAVAICASVVGINLFALLVLWRRAVGGIERPLPAALLLLTACGVAVWAWLSRHVGGALVASHQAATWIHSSWLKATLAWAPSVAIVMLTLGLSWPMYRLVDWLVWLPLWVADVLWRQTLLAGEPLARVDGETGEAQNGMVGGKPFLREDRTAESRVLTDDETLLQQLTRSRDAEGHESIRGTLCAEFVPQQKTGDLYVAFCPPFSRTPQIEFEQTDGPPARISLSRALPHGARLDVRLADAAPEVRHVYIEVYARE